MRPNLKSVLAGGIALAGVAGIGPALAGDGQPHVMNLRLPDGSIAQIQYTGDVPPQVAVMPAPVAIAAPPFFAPPGFGAPFAMMERMSAMMDRQAEMMLRQAAAMQAAMNAPAANLPPGAQAYSISSTIGGGGVCMRSVQVTYSGDSKPQVVSRTAGNCGPAQQGGAPSEVNAPAPVVRPPMNQPRTIEVNAGSDRPVLAMAQPAGLAR